MDISLYFTDGSDRLDWYSHASMLLAAGLLAVFVLFVRRLGPAATVLPWCAFYLATRSQDGYYLLMTPLWLASAVTAPIAEFRTAAAAAPRLLSGPHRRQARVAAAVLLVTPALASAAVAATGAPPMAMQLTGVRRALPTVVTRLTLRVTNSSGDALTPHYTLTTGQGMSRYWSQVSGPATLPAHSTETIELRPPNGAFTLPHKNIRIRVRAFTATPQTLSSSDLRLRPTG